MPQNGLIEVLLDADRVFAREAGRLGGAVDETADVGGGTGAAGQLVETDLQDDAARDGRPHFVRQLERAALSLDARDGGVAAVGAQVLQRGEVRAEHLAMALLRGGGLGALPRFFFANLFPPLRRDEDRNGHQDQAEEDLHDAGRAFADQHGETEEHEDHAERQQGEDGPRHRRPFRLERHPERHAGDVVRLDVGRGAVEARRVAEEVAVAVAADELAVGAGAEDDVAVGGRRVVRRNAESNPADGESFLDEESHTATASCCLLRAWPDRVAQRRRARTRR